MKVTMSKPFWLELLFVRFTHDWWLLVLVVFFVLILIIVVIVRVARRHDGEGIGDQPAEVLRDAEGHIVAPRTCSVGKYRTSPHYP
jgi:hypothetical protein